MDPFRQTKRRGAALMLSLWALFLLSAMVISWALEINARVLVSGNQNRVVEATAMACSGSEVALYPTINPGSEVLNQRFSNNMAYRVRLTGEGGRLNLRWVLQVPERPERIELLRKFLEVKGVDLNERDQMIDTLLDWVDPDNLVRLNGAEEEGGYKAANKMFTRLDELKKVKGWEEFTAMANWDSDLTLDSTGPIDIFWATRDVLLALPGTDEQRVDQFIAMRSGADEIDGTEDDPFLTQGGIQQALAVLGIAQVPQIASLIAAGPDPVWRIISEGKSGEIIRTVRMVVRKQQNQSTLMSWKEY